ncbi:hypothetical protein O988_04631 [Pseudogymnoascus sp. VKM F-3808]|nr:hypothetical protein O988_04631 [Pseudogymnoascus sp. VKM F-3808]
MGAWYTEHISSCVPGEAQKPQSCISLGSKGTRPLMHSRRLFSNLLHCTVPYPSAWAMTRLSCVSTTPLSSLVELWVTRGKLRLGAMIGLELRGQPETASH